MLTSSLSKLSHLRFLRTLMITMLPPRQSKIITHFTVLRLVTSIRFLWPCKVTYSQVLRSRIQLSLGGPLLSTTTTFCRIILAWNCLCKCYTHTHTHTHIHSACATDSLAQKDYGFSNNPKPIPPWRRPLQSVLTYWKEMCLWFVHLHAGWAKQSVAMKGSN